MRGLAMLLLHQCAWPQVPASPLALPKVEIISTSLLPGLGTALQDVPANVQVHTDRQMARQRPGSLTEYLEGNASSVNINSAQGNPFQPDVSFRGFAASPLLGLPQGLSVFQDGVRVNEPFGDVVNWDLIPQSAIASLQLLPGSHPGFGLNTLGGALSIFTKSGATHPGGSIETYGGSFGRRAMVFEQGGSRDDWNYFVTGNLFRDHGWTDHNPSEVRQFFGKVGYVAAQSTLDLSLTFADNALEGSQTLPLSFSDNRRQAYTFPDRNSNRLGFLNIKGSHLVDDKILLDGNLYYRKYRNQNVSSNVNGQYDAISDLVPASNDRSTIDQRGYGVGLQLTYQGEIAGRKHQLVVGGNADLGHATFVQETQDAAFSATREAIASSEFGLTTSAKSDNRYYGVFVNDTLTLTDRWALTLSGRYSRANIRIRDQTGAAADLNAEHSFARFNPAVGLNFNPTSGLTVYAAYNEGMRAPTPIELTCANPAAPCKLPNNFLSDPPLSKVVARTVEFGARGKAGPAFTWSAAAYRTMLDDDIQFISSLGLGSSSGYFQNVGNSLRQGLELAAANKWGTTGISLSYGFIDATYQSAFSVLSQGNSAADAAGNIMVSPGNRIPGIPRQSVKLRIEQGIDPGWTAGISISSSSGVYARGDENNQDVNGRLAGFTVVSADTQYRFPGGLELFGRINNLFDRIHANFGTLGRNAFTGPDRTFDGLNSRYERFLGYAAPRGIWVGLRYGWK